MHSVTICFGPAGANWNLLFKTPEKAQQTFDSLFRGDGLVSLVVEDDFGMKVLVKPAAVHGVFLEDMDVSQMAAVERGLHQARSQAKAQSRAMSDPVLKSAMMSQGPAVHSPFMNGRMS